MNEILFAKKKEGGTLDS